MINLNYSQSLPLLHTKLLKNILEHTFKGGSKENWTINLFLVDTLDNDTYAECDILTKKQKDSRVITISLDHLLASNCLYYGFARMLGHELEHARQVISGELTALEDENFFIWKGEKISLDLVQYSARPWEHEALKAEEVACEIAAKLSENKSKKELA